MQRFLSPARPPLHQGCDAVVLSRLEVGRERDLNPGSIRRFLLKLFFKELLPGMGFAGVLCPRWCFGVGGPEGQAAPWQVGRPLTIAAVLPTVPPAALEEILHFQGFIALL